MLNYITKPIVRPVSRSPFAVAAFLCLAFAGFGCGKKEAAAPPAPAGAAALPAAATPTTPKPIEPTFEPPPLPAPVSAATDGDFEAIKADSTNFKGKVVACRNVVAPIPATLSEFADATARELLGDRPLASRRTTLYCRTAGFRSVAVQMFLAKGEEVALLTIQRDSVVNLEIAGGDGRNVVAMWKGTVAAKEPVAIDRDLPDLLSAVLWPTPHVGRTEVCTSKAAVVPATVDAIDDAAKKMLAGLDDGAGIALAARKARLRCADRRGRDVGVLLFMRDADEPKVLEIGKDTVLRIRIAGFDRNQLVARFEGIVSGGIAHDPNDLRALFLAPDKARGQTVVCDVVGHPQPQEVADIHKREIELVGQDIADRKSWLMCRQPGGGIVNISVWFDKDVKKRKGAKGAESASTGKTALLGIVSKSKVRIRIAGVYANRLVGRYVDTTLPPAKAGAAAPSVPAWRGPDLRQIALDTQPWVGRKVPCHVQLQPFLAEHRYLDPTKKTLLSGEVHARHAQLTCQDAGGSLGGTRVEVYFKPGQTAALDELAKGDDVTLEIRGMVFNNLIAKWVGEAGEVRKP